MENTIVFFSNVELWSISENQGGRAQISTIRKYISSGWRVIYISTTGLVPDEIRAQASVIETNYNFITKIAFSNYKILHIFKYLRHLLVHCFFLKQGRKVLNKYGNKNIILYAYEVDAVLPVQKLAKKYRIPYVTRFQGTVHAKTEDNWINRVRFYPDLQALKATSDMIIMTDDGTQGLKTLKRLGNKTNKIHFWRNGVANIDISENVLEQFKKEKGLLNKYVYLTVSRLVQWKRVDRAITSFSKIANKVPDAELHIIGEGEEKGRLIGLAQKLGVSSKVVFHGSVNQSDVFLYMRSSKVFLSLYELSNVGNPLLEAMRAGLPIITLDNGDTGTIIKNNYNGILISESNTQDIPVKMLELATNQMLSKALSLNALEYAGLYFWTWEERMETEFQEVRKLISK